MAASKRRRSVSSPSSTGRLGTSAGTKKTLSLIGNLMQTLEQQQFKDDLQKAAKHLGMSEKEVLTTILGR